MTMVEKIARAIYSQHGFCYDDDERMFEPYPFDELDEIERSNFVSQARAVLTALREPTENMIDMGACHEDQDHHIVDEGSIAQDVWRAMVDAAIEEGKDK